MLDEEEATVRLKTLVDEWSRHSAFLLDIRESPPDLLEVHAVFAANPGDNMGLHQIHE